MQIADVVKYIRLDVWYRICFISQRIRDIAIRDHDSREIRECNHLLMLVMLLPRDRYGSWSAYAIIRNRTLKWSHLVMLNYLRDSESGIPDVYDPGDLYFGALLIRGDLEEIKKWIPRLRSYIAVDPENRPSATYHISENFGITIEFIRTYPDMINYDVVSENESIPMSEIIGNQDIQWNWQFVSYRSDIDWDFVMQHSEFNWNWVALSRTVSMSVMLSNPQMPWSMYGLGDNNNLTHRVAIKLSITDVTYLFACIPISVLKAEGLYDIDKTRWDYYQIDSEKIKYLMNKYPNAYWKSYCDTRLHGASSYDKFYNDPKYTNYRRIKSYRDVIDHPELPWDMWSLSQKL